MASMKEKIAGWFGNISGAVSALGSAPATCHTICMSVISLLAVIGITVAGMPFAFITEYNKLFWGIGAGFLALGAGLYHRHRSCMSGKLLSANAGFIVAGFPFVVAPVQYAFWILGTVIVVGALSLFVKERWFP